MTNLSGLDPNTITTNPNYQKSIFEHITSCMPCIEGVVFAVANFFGAKESLLAEEHAHHENEAVRITKLIAEQNPAQEQQQETSEKVTSTLAVVKLTNGEVKENNEEPVIVNPEEPSANKEPIIIVPETLSSPEEVVQQQEPAQEEPIYAQHVQEEPIIIVPQALSSPEEVVQQQEVAQEEPIYAQHAEEEATHDAAGSSSAQATLPTLDDIEPLIDADFTQPLENDEENITVQAQEEQIAGSAAPTDTEDADVASNAADESDGAETDDTETEATDPQSKKMYNIGFQEFSFEDVRYWTTTTDNTFVKEEATAAEMSDLRFPITSSNMKQLIAKIDRHSTKDATGESYIATFKDGRTLIYLVTSEKYRYRNGGVQFQKGVVEARLPIDGVKKKYSFELLGFLK